MYRPRIEALEERKLFSVTDLIIDPFNANVLDNNAATDDMSLSVTSEARAITVNPATAPGFGLQAPLMERGLDASSAHTYGPRGPLSYNLKLQELLVSSYSAGHAADPSGVRAAAIDGLMVDWGDGQTESILHEDNEFSFPRMLTANRASASVYAVWVTVGVAQNEAGGHVPDVPDFDNDGDVDGADF